MIGAWAAVLTATVAAGPAISPGAVTSAYTRIELDRCARVDAGDEHQSATWRCKGYAGIPLIVQSGDDRYDIDAGLEDADEFWGQSFDYPGETVEWRLRRGVPFAIIYRLVSSGSASPRSSRLMVETIGRGAPGCRIASIDGRLRRANALARRAADEIAAGRARCMKDQ